MRGNLQDLAISYHRQILAFEYKQAKLKSYSWLLFAHPPLNYSYIVRSRI